MNKTKIVATIGPSSQEKETLKQLILSGMNVARLNLSYATHDFCDEIIDKIHELNEELNTSVAVMLDLDGPTVTVGKLIEQKIYLKKGNLIQIYGKERVGDDKTISVNYPNLVKDMKYNSHIVLGDNEVLLTVIDKEEDCLTCKIEEDAILKENMKLISLDCSLQLPFLTEKDKEDILYAHEKNVDFIALSFVTSSENILEVNDLLINLNDDRLSILAKIETEEAVEEIDEIIRVADGILVARGDLGVALPMERIPGIQKMIISKCHRQGKVSVVATEMLGSMEFTSHPTRAEVSDVANAVLDGVDAVMLSGETTIGDYPVETLSMMAKIIESSEDDIDYRDLLDKAMRTEKNDITGSLAYSVTDNAERLRCTAIVAPTITGYTAKKISRFRPVCPIIALSPDEAVVKSLALHFGVYGFQVTELNSFDKVMRQATESLKEFMEIKEGDKIIVTGGYPFKEVKHTNFMRIEEL
ncbi:MAG: pyruvate kinase [Firmicutes bacterium]|nr:pyruvate kinase [Bacillota bacterium]